MTGSVDPFDVIVLGGGAAGSWAAFHAARTGANVAVIAKGLAGRAGATVSSGGRIAVCGETLVDELGLDADPTDSKEKFFRNILDGGSHLGDPFLARAVVDGVGAELRILQDEGVQFPVTPGGVGRGPGSSVRTPGPDLQRAINRLAVRAGVRFWEDFHAVELLRDDAGPSGVIGVDRNSGTVETIAAKAIVVATGGTSSNWLKRDTPEELAGDGQAMALRAGAELIDADFMQFLPCCVLHPQLWRGQQFTWRILGPQGGIHARLLNRHGERFMARWSPDKMEFASSDLVSLAVAAEITEGRGSPGGGVYLSWAHLPRALLNDVPLWHEQVRPGWNWQGYELQGLMDILFAEGAIEVAPVAHCSLGGIRIDGTGATRVGGLFACGEATGGLHGIDRLQGTALAQALVQGRASGLSAADHARGRASVSTGSYADARDRILAPLRREDGLTPHEVRERLVTLTDAVLGPRRIAAELDEALATVRDIRENALPRLACRTRDPRFNRDWSDALECDSASLAIEAMILSARSRAEPASDDLRWNGIVSLRDDGLAHERHLIGSETI
jgi:succinate dehydrogenase/fumarate reductase flavoprotein subunit